MTKKVVDFLAVPFHSWGDIVGKQSFLAVLALLPVAFVAIVLIDLGIWVVLPVLYIAIIMFYAIGFIWEEE